MNKILRAVTLVELIISTLIIAMVVAGVFSADYALRRINESGSKDVKVHLQARAVAESVRATARKVQGDLTNSGSNSGYYCPGGQTFCFRYDGGFTPAVGTDDSWLCYTQIGVNVYSCERFNVAAPAACAATDTVVGQLASDQFSISAPDCQASGPGAYYFQMTFVGRDDPASPASETNPETRMTIREKPLGF